MRTKIDRLGVMILLAHLLITLALLVLYGLFMYFGKETTTVENMLLVVIGYWFGSMGMNAVRPNAQTQIQQANEVQVHTQTEQQPRSKDV